MDLSDNFNVAEYERRRLFLPVLWCAMLLALAISVDASATVTPQWDPPLTGVMGMTGPDGGAAKGAQAFFQRRLAPETWLAQGGEGMLANPDWVHPANRKNYPGYAIRKQKKKDGRDWQYRTNRPGGNTRGGGTTPYLRYRSFYRKTLTSPVKRRK